MQTLVALGDYAFDKADWATAERRAREALAIEPEQADALVLMGRVLLRAGKVREARSHALSALGANAMHAGTLHLLAAAKARASWLLGLWWRYNAWVNERGQLRAVAILLALYVVYRFIDAVALDFGKRDVSMVINLAWLALVIYTWVGPAVFEKALKKDLAQVRLRSEF